MLDGGGLRGTKRKMSRGEAWNPAMDWWNVTTKQGEEKCPHEKWSGTLLQQTRCTKTSHTNSHFTEHW